MPSPFPGMDPYLERHWGDVHTRLITSASDPLQKFLPKDLRARVEERTGRFPRGPLPLALPRCACHRNGTGFPGIGLR